MTLQQKLKRIGDALAVIPNMYHYYRPQLTPPFGAWAYDSEVASFAADNRKREQVITGFVSYYTQTEYDPTLDRIREIMNGFNFPFEWRLESLEDEEDTELIDYEWTWSGV